MLKYILVFLRYYKDSVFYFDILIFSKSLFDSPAEKAARRGVLDNKVSADGLPLGAQPAAPDTGEVAAAAGPVLFLLFRAHRMEDSRTRKATSVFST